MVVVVMVVVVVGVLGLGLVIVLVLFMVVVVVVFVVVVVAGVTVFLVFHVFRAVNTRVNLSSNKSPPACWNLALRAAVVRHWHFQDDGQRPWRCATT